MTSSTTQAPELPSSGACGVPAAYEAWKCALCDAYKVVPSLARDCEQRHLESP